MSNILKKAANIKLVSIIIAAVLAVAIAVGVICGTSGLGVFHKDVLLKDANTVTVSVNQYVYGTALEEVESECESVLSKHGIVYEMKGEMSGDVSEIVYVFNSDVKELTKAVEELQTKLDALAEAKNAEISVTVNSEKAVGVLAAGYIWRGIVAAAVLVVLVFGYVAIRYGLTMGITAGTSTLVGTLLTTALIIITRLPVTASVIYVIAVGALLSAVMSVIALNKIREENEVVVATNEIGTLSVLMAAAIVVIGAVATSGVRMFALLALVALVAAVFVGLVLVPAMYTPFKVAADNKPVEGAYVGAVKTSTKEKKVYAKKQAPAKAVAPAPVEEAPVEEEVPVEEALIEEAPVEEAPIEEAPVEEAPVEEIEEAPATEEVAEEKQD